MERNFARQEVQRQHTTADKMSSTGWLCKKIATCFANLSRSGPSSDCGSTLFAQALPIACHPCHSIPHSNGHTAGTRCRLLRFVVAEAVSDLNDYASRGSTLSPWPAITNFDRASRERASARAPAYVRRLCWCIAHSLPCAIWPARVAS